MLENGTGPEKPLSIGDAWLNMVCKIAKRRQVFIMKAVPATAIPVVDTLVQSVLNGTILELDQKSFDRPLVKHKEFTARQDALLERAANECGVTVFDPAEVLCEGDVCRGTTADIIPLYRDGNHLNLFASRKLIPLFEKTFDAVIK